MIECKHNWVMVNDNEIYPLDQLYERYYCRCSECGKHDKFMSHSFSKIHEHLNELINIEEKHSFNILPKKTRYEVISGGKT